jgi:hypothetical protein
MRSMLTACRARWKRLSPLTRDVTLILLFKVTALGLIWWLFFSAPLAPGMHVAPDRVADRLLAPLPPPGAADADR